MIAAILGKKVGMTRVYDDSGVMVPATVIQAGPCTVLQVKTQPRDGYEAVQLGFEDLKPKRAKLPLIGHCGKAGTGPKRFIREVRLAESTDCEAGETVTVAALAEQEVAYVDITGVTKGKGFAGVMKRWDFAGQPASHGTERKHRSPGSISSHGSELGGSGGIKKGKKMAGHMGRQVRTSRNHKVLRIVPEHHLLVVKGSVPGPNGGYLVIRPAKIPPANGG